MGADRHFFDEFLDQVLQLSPLAQLAVRRSILVALDDVNERCYAMVEMIDAGTFQPEHLLLICPLQMEMLDG